MAASDDQEFSDFSAATNFATFPLEIDGKTLFVNPNTIAEMSPVFAAMMFSEGFKEQKDQVVSIKDEKYEDILEMFRCLLPTPKSNWKVRPITAATFPKMFELADKYEFPLLTAYCESFIQENFASQPAETYQLIDMLESAVNFSLAKEYMEVIVKRASELPFFELKHPALDRSSLPAYIVTKLLYAQVEKEERRTGEQKRRADCEKSRADQEERRANGERERAECQSNRADAERDRANNEKQQVKDLQNDLRLVNAEKRGVEMELRLAKNETSNWSRSDPPIGSAVGRSRRP